MLRYYIKSCSSTEFRTLFLENTLLKHHQIISEKRYSSLVKLLLEEWGYEEFGIALYKLLKVKFVYFISNKYSSCVFSEYLDNTKNDVSDYIYYYFS